VSKEALLQNISTRNSCYFEVELKKLDGWADDQIASSEKALKDIKKRIRDLRNEFGKSNDLSEQAQLQDNISDLERHQRKLRQEIFEMEDRILAQRDQLVSAIRSKLKQSVSTAVLFSVRWSLMADKSNQ
jgi:predicted  nucleic acid-binding Zn-ribbon protein